jgi:hypothetical protein
MPNPATTPSIFVLAALAGAVLTGQAQVRSPELEQPATAVDKSVVESAFSKADLNGDGKVSKEEAVRLPAIGAKFDQLDTNRDGGLRLDEFAGGFVTAN